MIEPFAQTPRPDAERPANFRGCREVCALIADGGLGRAPIRDAREDLARLRVVELDDQRRLAEGVDEVRRASGRAPER